jgi:hypothetical protein
MKPLLRPRTVVVLALTGLSAFLLLFSADVQGQGKKGDLDPRGKPKQFDKGNLTGYAVWHSPKGWHLRTTTDTKKHRFRGTITVEGGTFGKIHSSHLEKEGRLEDHWKVGPKRHQLNFEFDTNKGIDGVDFTVAKEADLIRFDLHIDGKEAPGRTFVGSDGDHPRGMPFHLLAHPGKKKK